MEKKKMDKKYRVGIATIAVVITAAIFAGLSVSAYDHDQTYKWNATYFVPEDIRVTEYCKNVTVDIWTNTSVKIIGGVLEFNYTFCCANVTGFTFNASNWPSTTSAYRLTPGKVRLVPSNSSGVGPGPVHIGTLKIHCCNKSSCCLTNLTWNTTASYLQDLSGFKIPVSWKNGTFTCGNPIEVNKTMKDPTTNAWVKSYKFPMGTAPPVNVTFKVIIHSKCCNLTNLVVWDNFTGNIEFVNASITPDFVSPTRKEVRWDNASNLSLPLKPCKNITIIINATITDYSSGTNTLNATGICSETGVKVSADDVVSFELPPPAQIEVEKKVWNKTAGKWVDVIHGAKIGEIYRFNCTIHNSGSYNLTNITFNDTLSPSLEYVGNATMETPNGIKRNITMSGNGTDYEVNSFLQDPLTLKPSQRIFIEFDAKVVNYGNDSNVQCVKGYSVVGGKWVHDCDDAWIDTPKPDLNVSKITVNEDVPYLCDMAFGPTNHTGAKKQCNNISAVIEEVNGVDVVFPFNVTFKITNTSTGAEVGKCVKRLPGLAAGANETVWCNCSFYPFAYENYTISVTVDSNITAGPNGEILESDENNNTMVRNITAHEYGWKGDSWQDGRNITALQCHEQGHINLTYSVGNSTRLSAWSHPHWTDYYVEWTRDDFSVIPSTNTCIKKARLYVYYDWDKSTGQNITDYLSLTFNGFAKTPVEYTDIKAPDLIGSCSCPDYMHDLYPSCGPGYTTTYYDICSYNYRYGMLAYDVTDEFILDGNIAHLHNAYPGGNNVSIDGMLLVVVYSHPDEPERIIWINEGFDMLKSGLTKYTKCKGPTTIYHWGPTGISPEEATTYATFTPFPECPEIPVDTIGSVRLVTVTKDATPGAADGKNTGHALYFNGELLGMDTVWGSSSGVRNAINDTIVPLNLLKPSNNTVAFRSYGDAFEATNAFLVLEKAGHKSISVEPEEIIVQPQDQFDVNITLDTHGYDVYAVQYTLKYDPSVLRSESQVSGDFLSHDGNKTIVVVNKIDHATGTIEYAETRIGTDTGVTGRGTVAKIQFTAIGEPGATTFSNITEVVLVDSNKQENKEYV
ncbi:MAG: hypothetical protein DRN20_05370, partial [Thermoplasmata archaeon]